MKSIDEIARGMNVPEFKVQNVLKRIQNKRTVHRFHRKGWSNDKGKTMMAEGAIPLWVWLHPDFKDTYFSDECDRHEREKNIRKFFHDYPEFKTR